MTLPGTREYSVLLEKVTLGTAPTLPLPMPAPGGLSTRSPFPAHPWSSGPTLSSGCICLWLGLDMEMKPGIPTETESRAQMMGVLTGDTAGDTLEVEPSRR